MIIPQLPSSAFRTFEIVAPVSTHWRKASCAEVNCAQWRNGWKTIIGFDSEAALYIRTQSGRRFVETRDGGMVTFTFEAGQTCFASDSHRVPLERDPIFIARGGDARGNPLRERRVHVKPEDWVEDFAHHQDRLKQSRGE